MDIQNHFYGHSAVYAAYCGLRRPRHVDGLIQHGWSPVSPISAHFVDLAGSAPDGGLFVWSHSSRGWNEAETQRETGFRSTAVGSPFLYLLDMVRESGAIPEQSLGTVVIPFHGTRLVGVDGDHRALANEIRDREGAATVCMHVDDLQRPDVVRAWREAGHHLTTAGERRDPDFLARILWLVLSAQRVVSNRLATALVYAAAAGVPTEIYGPHFQLTNTTEASSPEQMRATWPEFYGPDTDTASLVKVADIELGRGDMRTRGELRSLLGWGKPSVSPFLRYWLGAPLEKAQLVLGLKERNIADPTNHPNVPAWQFLRHPFEHLPAPLPRSTSRSAVRPNLAQPVQPRDRR